MAAAVSTTSSSCSQNCAKNDEEGDMVQPPPPFSPNSGKMCIKCKVKEAECQPRSDPMCKSCVYDSIIVGFRGALCGAKCRLPANRGILAISNSASSRLSVHLMHFCKVDRRGVRCDIQMVHIDEGAAFGEDKQKRQQRCQELSDFVRGYNFDLQVVPLEEVFRDQAQVDEDRSSRLSQIFSNCPNLDAKEQLLHKLRSNLLSRLATEQHFEHIILCSNANRIAASIVADVAYARGGSIALTSSPWYKLAGEENITWVQPLRETLISEVNAALEFLELFIPDSKLCRPQFGSGSSITQCSNELIEILQKEKTFVAHTVIRSVQKLSQLSPTTEGVRVCPSCHCPWKAVGNRHSEREGSDVCFACSELLKSMQTNAFVPPSWVQTKEQILAEHLLPADE